jgi:multidrug resistance efflux pump
MRLRTLFPVLAMLSALAAHAQDALPARAANEKPEAEPKLFLNDLGDALTAAEDMDLATLAKDTASDADVDRAKAEYERAQRKQERWQRLAKSGVLAQVEAEAAVLQAARARVKYERTRVLRQQQEFEALRPRVASGQLTPDALAAAESALKTAQVMAAEADAALRRTQLLQAEINVERQRRLSAAGVSPKRMLQRAQATLEQLKTKPE